MLKCNQMLDLCREMSAIRTQSLLGLVEIAANMGYKY